MIIPNIWENKKCSKPPTGSGMLFLLCWHYQTICLYQDLEPRQKKTPPGHDGTRNGKPNIHPEPAGNMIWYDMVVSDPGSLSLGLSKKRRKALKKLAVWKQFARSCHVSNQHCIMYIGASSCFETNSEHLKMKCQVLSVGFETWHTYLWFIRIVCVSVFPL